jgi:hypothetical protein
MTATLGASFPAPSSDLSLAYSGPAEATLAASFPVPSSSLAAELAQSATIGASLPAPTASLSVESDSEKSATLDASFPLPSSALLSDVSIVVQLGGVFPMPYASLYDVAAKPVVGRKHAGEIRLRLRAAFVSDSVFLATPDIQARQPLRAILGARSRVDAHTTLHCSSFCRESATSSVGAIPTFHRTASTVVAVSPFRNCREESEILAALEAIQ